MRMRCKCNVAYFLTLAGRTRSDGGEMVREKEGGEGARKRIRDRKMGREIGK